MRIKTYVAIVLDKSGSMGKCRSQAVEWYNEQIQQYKENAKEQDIEMCLVTFNGNVFEHIWLQPAETLQESTVEEYIPLGGTAMRDALVFTIQKLRDTTKPAPEDAYLVICISDGDSRDDKHFHAADLKALIDEVKATNQWTFTFMGCEEKYLYALSRETGVIASNFAAWSNASPEIAAAGLRNSNSRSYGYFADRKKGLTSKLDYMNDDVGCVADFTGSTKTDEYMIGSADFSPPNAPSIHYNDSPKVNCGKPSCCGGFGHGTAVDVSNVAKTNSVSAPSSVLNPVVNTKFNYSVDNSVANEKTVFGASNRVKMTR